MGHRENPGVGMRRHAHPAKKPLHSSFARRLLHSAGGREAGARGGARKKVVGGAEMIVGGRARHYSEELTCQCIVCV